MKEIKKCPTCGEENGQVNNGHNRSGTQRVLCRSCGKTYTMGSKRREYPEETQKLALKMYYSGVSGRGVGKVLNMDKSNVYNWIKKAAQILEANYQISELDELYWFIERKAKTETRENVYVMTMVSREPRQIVGFEVARDKAAQHIQGIVDHSPWAKQYCTDGYYGYLDTVFPGQHIYNIRDKSNTFTVEGVNADLRHYIPVLARRSRCFARKLETLQAVLAVFQEAYNKFGKAKLLWFQMYDNKTFPRSLFDFLRSTPFDTPEVAAQLAKL
jgi:transposase-like protein/IS1 family transposase